MKLYITGSVGSGKTSLARRISLASGVPFVSLDEVVYVSDTSATMGNKKRSEAEREALFDEILSRESYIIEDTGRRCFVRGLEEADTVALLAIPRAVCRKRIIKRWIKQNLGMEQSFYRPRVRMLRAMLKWNKEYDNSAFSRFADKTVRLETDEDVERFCARYAAADEQNEKETARF